MDEHGSCNRCRSGGSTVGRKIQCERYWKIVHPSAGNVCQGFSAAAYSEAELEAIDGDWQRKYRLENPRED